MFKLMFWAIFDDSSFGSLCLPSLVQPGSRYGVQTRCGLISCFLHWSWQQGLSLPASSFGLLL